MLDDLRSYVETAFGSDAALGIRLRVMEDGQGLRFDDLIDLTDPRAPDIDAESVFPDGSSATQCTAYARIVQRDLEAKGHRVAVVGFDCESNADCLAVEEEWHPCGHDFAIVDDRFLVDPWARLVAGVRDEIVYDLADPSEAAEAIRIYGHPARWAELDPPASEPRFDPDRLGVRLQPVPRPSNVARMRP